MKLNTRMIAESLDQSSIEELERLLNEKRAEYKKLGDELQTIFTQYKKAREAQIVARNPNDIADLIKTYTTEFKKGHDSQTLYRKIKKWAESHGIGMEGYWPKTYEPAFRISLNKSGSNIPQVYSAIKELSEILTPQEEGYVVFEIFEHTLSEYGSYDLLVKGNNAKIVMNNRRTEFTGGLTDALDYIAEHHWYKNDVDEDEESEDYYDEDDN